MRSIEPYLKHVRQRLLGPLLDQADLILSYTNAKLLAASPNPLNRFGAKYFSQADEDGITLQILQRLNLQDGTFAELGVGDGSENNTLILIANGWSGFWIGGERLFFDYREGLYKNFYFARRWIERTNVVQFANEALRNIHRNHIDVISVDLDGNDIYIVEELLTSGLSPALFIVEYNAKFPPPIEWRIEYKANHVWVGDDYFGASLASYVGMFKKYGYSLVCCNAGTGANAFFVKNRHMSEFSDVPSDINAIYYAPRYYVYSRFGHRLSPKTVTQMLLKNESR
jgi:hypothetical protein